MTVRMKNTISKVETVNVLKNKNRVSKNSRRSKSSATAVAHAMQAWQRFSFGKQGGFIMAITGIGNGYNNVYKNTYVSQKNEEVKQAETKETSSAQTGKSKNEANSSVSDYYSLSCKEV